VHLQAYLGFKSYFWQLDHDELIIKLGHPMSMLAAETIGSKYSRLVFVALGTAVGFVRL
jgi:hypothetical protein